jgi:nitrite reductase/ring-hydroxylating ferredoxin subunit
VAAAPEQDGAIVELFPESELEPGAVRAVQVGTRALAIIRKRDGTFRALRDRCPHQGACLSNGKLRPMVTSPGPGVYELSEDREILHCPWHEFEFDVDTGRSPGNPNKMRVAAYEVSVVDGMVRVHLKKRGGRV